MLNTTQQKAHLYSLLSIIHAYEAASSFPDNDTRLVSLEQQYRDELQILLNSLACGSLNIAGAIRGTLEAIGNAVRSDATQYDDDSFRCGKCGAGSPIV